MAVVRCHFESNAVTWLAGACLVACCGALPGCGSQGGPRGWASAAGGMAPTDQEPPGPSAGAVPEPGVTFIQEDELGFSGVDGLVLPRQGSTSISGYTGTGFADSDSGVGKTLGYSVHAEATKSHAIALRYAFGGAAANTRDAALLVNGAVVQASVPFPYTTTWNDWQETAELAVDLAAGTNFIQFSATGPGGLANVDYLKISGEGITADSPRFVLGVAATDASVGSVSVTPDLAFYEPETEILLTAVPAPGYFFQSFTGDVTSDAAEHRFVIRGNTAVAARFLPDGTTQVEGVQGYATVQDDDGTPYLLTGGALGPEVTATTLEELTSYLESPDPYVVTFSGTLAGADAIEIASDKTLRGIGDSAHLVGVELAVNGSRNVIIQNVAVSHVVADGAGTANDAIVLSGAQNVWVDHCELYSDLANGKDYYDGLLELKNGASFVTVSNTHFHDHFKVSLISSGDEQVGDSVIRATYHHNYFHDCGSRLPSIRFGRAHLFNNYYRDNTDGSGVNSRMGAVVKVEGNYFLRTKDPIGWFEGPEPGSWEVRDNVFDACSGSQPETSNGALDVPYDYTLDAAADVPALVEANAGVGRL
jgi:pectate lyase